MTKASPTEVSITNSRLATQLFKENFELLSQETVCLGLKIFVFAVPTSKLQTYRRILNGV